MPRIPHVVVSTTITTVPSVTAQSGYVLLYHGSRQEHIDSILNFGVNAAQAKLCAPGQGSFTASPHFLDAVKYSQKGPFTRGDPAILQFEVKVEVMDHLGNEDLVYEYDEGWFKFYAPSFDKLNDEMKAVVAYKSVMMNVGS